MKVAIIAEVAGAPLSLAATAFVGTLAEGMASTGAATRIIGLAHTTRAWSSESLAFGDVSTPWIDRPKLRLQDRAEAARRGIMGGARAHGCHGGDIGEWSLELLFQRELDDLGAGDRDGVVLAYTRSQPLLGMSVRAARRLGWRVVTFATEALSDAQIDPATRDDYIRCVVDHCDGIWSVSRHLAEYWATQGVPRERIFVSPPPIRASYFTEAEPPRDMSAVYLGNLMHREIEYLLDITDEVLAHVPEFRLTIYGDAPEGRRTEIGALVADRSLGDAVSLRPPVSVADVPGALISADVLLLPRGQGEFSDAGFPNKLGEYLASGRPVVVTGVGDIPAYLTDGTSARVVPADDTAAFAAAVVGVLRDPARAAALGAAGRAVASELSRADVVAGRLLAFIRTLPQPMPAAPGGAIRGAAAFVRSCIPDAKRFVVRVLRALRLKRSEPETVERRAS